MLPVTLHRMLKQCTSKSSKRSVKRPRRFTPLVLNMLEERVNPATIIWDAATGGDWLVPSNWDLGRVPAPGDEVIIPDINAAGADQTISIGQSNISVASIASAENLQVDGAATVLTLTGVLPGESSANISVAGEMSLVGTLRDADLASGTLLRVTSTQGAVLDGVTVGVGAQLDIAERIRVTNGLTLNGTGQYFFGGQLDFSAGSGTVEDQRLTGSGTLRAGDNILLHLVTPAAFALTIGSDLNLEAASSSISGQGQLVNQGTFLMNGAGTGGGVTINVGRFVNQGNINISPETTRTFAIEGDWTNTGTIDLNTGSLTLGGTFFADDIGTLDRGPTGSDGTVQLTGTLTNVLRVEKDAPAPIPQTLTLDDAGGYGSWELRGSIVGGSVATLNNAKLTLRGFPTLDGVRIATGSLVEIDTSGSSGMSSIRNGLTVDGTLQVLSGGIVDFYGDQVLAGVGKVLLPVQGSAGAGASFRVWNSATLTIDNDLQVSGSRGTIGVLAGSKVINRGTIRAEDGNGGVLQISADDFDNQGQLEVLATGILELAGGWTNTGTIALTAGELRLAGNFGVADIGTILRANDSTGLPTEGTVSLTGTLENTNPVSGNPTSLVLDSAVSGLGSWRLSGGTIVGGSVVTLNDARLTLIGSPILEGVTIATDAVVEVLSGAATLRNGLTVNGTLHISGSTVNIAESQVLDGNGNIRFPQDASSTGGVLQVLSGFTLTIGPDLTLSGGRAQIATLLNTTVVNRGTIRAESSFAGNISITSETFLNEGQLEVGANGSLQIGRGANVTGGSTWASLGTITTETGGELLLAGSFQDSDLTGLVRAGGTVTITGTLEGDFTHEDHLGDILLNGGTLRNGSYIALGAARLTIGSSSPQSRLIDYTLNSPIDLVSISGTGFRIQDGLTINTELQVGSPDGKTAALLQVFGSQMLSGSGSIIFGPATNVVFGNSPKPDLIIGPDLTVRGGTALFRQLGNLEIRGAFQSDITGGTIGTDSRSTVDRVSNLGVIRALNGGTVQLGSATLSNLSQGTLTGGVWEVFAGSSLRVQEAITNINADVRLSGGNSNLYTGVTGTSDAIAGLTSVGSEGSLSLQDGRSITATGDITNSGSLNLSPGSFIEPGRTSSNPLLVALWSGDGTAEDITGRHDGAPNGGVSYVTGVFGQAFSFAGDAAVVVSEQDGLRATNTLTIDARIFPTGNGSTTFGGSILTKEGEYTLARFEDGTIRWGFDNTDPDWSWTNTAFVAPLNQWTRITLTYDHGVVNTYANGLLVHTYNGSGPIGDQYPDQNELQIGNRERTSQPFAGRIDQVGLFNTPLTPAEIDSLTLLTAGTLTQAGGNTRINGSLRGNLTLESGTLGGTGTLDGDLVNSGGIVATGSSPGFLDITGDYTQTAAGLLDIEIAGREGTLPNPEYDRLRVSGTTTIDGTARVTYLGAFTPAPGDEFNVLTAALVTGQFATLEVPTPGEGRRLDVEYELTKVLFQTQPVPPVELHYATTQTNTPMDATENEDVVVDADGNAYVTGRVYAGTVDFDASGPAAAITVSTTSAFVAKYDPNGALLWVRLLEGVAGSAPIGLGIALDTSFVGTPEVVVTGSFAASANITDGVTSVTLTEPAGSGNTAAFLLRLTSAGGLVWAHELVGPGTEIGQAVSVGSDGAAYVAGRFDDSPDFDPSGASFNLSTAGGLDGFVWALDQSGGFLAAERLGGTSDDLANGVAVDSADAVWLTGSFTDITTGLASLTNTGTLSDAFVLKATRSGTSFTPVLARVYGGPGQDSGNDITVDPSDNALTAGVFEFAVDFDVDPDKAFTLLSSGETDAFTLKLESDGTFQWARPVGGYRSDIGRDIATDPLGNVYLTGSFRDAVDFDPTEASFILETDSVRAFTMRYGPDGRFRWAADLATSAGTSDGNGVDVGDDDRVITVGNFTGVTDFDPTEATVEPNPGGEARGFVWALDQKAAPAVSVLGFPSGSISEGDVLTLAASVSDADSTFFTYAWSVTRNGEEFASATSAVFPIDLSDQGNYQVRLTVLDESGNRDTFETTLAVNNTAPVLNPTTYGSGTPLAAPMGAASADQLGSSIAVGADVILIGSASADVTALVDAGAVQVYDTNGLFLRTLTADVPMAGAAFGTSVAIVGDVAVIGAPGVGAGSAFVIDPATGSVLRTLSVADGMAGDRFGTSVLSVGQLVLIGAPGRAGGGGSDSGIAYLFDPVSGALLQTFVNPTPTPGDAFGTALGLAGETLLIGSPGDDAAALDAGVVHLFKPGTPSLIGTLDNPNASFAGSNFGSVLATTGFLAIVGAPSDDSVATDAGGAYVFDLDPDPARFTTLLATLRNPNSGTGEFGAALSATGNRLLVAAPSDDATIADSGSVFLFDLAAPMGASFGTLLTSFQKPTPVSGDSFGASLGFLEDDLLIGAPFDDSTAVDAGRVYRFDATEYLNLTATSIDENGTVTVRGSFADRGRGDEHTAVITWGDGNSTTIRVTPGKSQFEATHQYTDDDPSGTATDLYTVQARVIDATSDIFLVDSLPGPDRVVRIDATTGGNFTPLIIDSGVSGAEEIAGIAVGPDGVLYVAYSGGGNPIIRFDPATGASLGVFATVSGGFWLENALAFGPDGTLYVADATAGYLIRFDQTGSPIGAPPGSDSIFNDPTPTPYLVAGSPFFAPQSFTVGLAGDIFVTEYATPGGTTHSFVQRFDGITGAFKSSVVGTGDTLLIEPTDIQFGPAGDLYVIAETSSRGLYQFDAVSFDLVRVAPLNETSPSSDFVRVTNQGDVFYADGGDGLSQSDGSGADPVPVVATGIFTEARMIDELGPQDSSSATVTVSNVTPSIVVTTVANPVGVPTGSFTLTSVVTDPGGSDSITYAWSVTGATVFGATDTPSITFTPTSAVVTATLTVSDDDAGSSTYTSQIIVGTAGGEAVTLTDTSATVGAGTPITIPGGASAPEQVVVFGLGGDDSLDASAVTSFTVELVGGDGSDTLTGGALGDVLVGNNPGDYDLVDPFTGDTSSDSLTGGAGNDTLDGGLGDDTMAGGLDDDTYIQVPGSADLLSEAGGNGVDTIDYQRAFYGITFSLSTTSTPQVVNPSEPISDQDTVEIIGEFENLTGSVFNDAFTGNLANNRIDGNLGDDIIFGGDELAVTFEETSGEDTLAGGFGNDTIVGGAGDDIIFGGDELATEPAPGIGEDDSIVGGFGNDTITGGAGDDIIFGGDELATEPTTGVGEDDLIVGGFGNDTITGGAGDDIIFGGDELATEPAPGIGEDDSIVGGFGNDTITGGAGDDIIFGGDELAIQGLQGGDDDVLSGGDGNDTLLGGEGSDSIRGDSGNDSIVGGFGEDTLVGGAGDDIIFGGDGNDLLAGEAGIDLFEGGIGFDSLVEISNFDITLTVTELTIGGQVERIYDIETARIGGGDGNNLIDASQFLGPVALFGFDGNDTLVGGGFGDLLVGGTGDDSLTGNAGPDTLETGPGTGMDLADGGNGNDTYLLPMIGSAQLIDSQGIDSVDISSAAFAVDIDLERATEQIRDTAGNIVELLGMFENIRGTSFADTIMGNLEQNILEGGGGVDVLDGRDGADTLQASFPQVIYLDFDSATGPKERNYTIEERNLIQARLEEDFSAPFSIAFTQTAPSVGRYSAIIFNAGDFKDTEALIAGLAFELDWRNVNAASRANINLNGFLGGPGQPAASSANYVALASTVAAHEIGHLLGLRHSDAFGPIGINPETGQPFGINPELQDLSRTEVVPGNSEGLPPGQQAYQFAQVLFRLQPERAPSGTIYRGATPVASFTILPDGAVAFIPTGDTLAPQTGTFNLEFSELTLDWGDVDPGVTQVELRYFFDPFRPMYPGNADASESRFHIIGSPASLSTSIEDALNNVYFGPRELIKLAFADTSRSLREAEVSVQTAAPFGTYHNLDVLPALAVPNLLPESAANHGQPLRVRAVNVLGTIELNGSVSENDIYAIQGRQDELLNVEVLSISLRQRLGTSLIDPVIRVYDASGELLDFYGSPAVNDDGIDNQDPVLHDIRLPNDGLYFIEVDTFTNTMVADLDVGDYELFIYTYEDPFAATDRLAAPGDVLTGGAGSDVLIGGTADDVFNGDPSEDIIIGATQTDQIVPSNNAPEALDGTVLTDEDTAFTALAASDADGDLLAFTLIQAPSNGTVEFDAETGEYTYAPTEHFHGSDSFRFIANDGQVDSREAVVTITVNSVNDAPSLVIAQAMLSVIEDTPMGISGLSIRDIDVGDAEMNVTLVISDTDGTLNGLGSSGVTVTSTTPYSLSLTGSLSDLNAYLAAAPSKITFTPVNDSTSDVQLDVTVDDQGNAGSGGSLTDMSNITLDLQPVNDAPTISAPASIEVTEDSITTLSGISAADVDAGTADVLLTLSVDAGELTANSVSGVVIGGTPTNLTLTGALSDLNALLTGGGVSYTPVAGSINDVTLTVILNDLGNSGVGGIQTDSIAINLKLVSVNDPPEGSDMTVIMPEDTRYVFSQSDFGFSDPNDTPPDDFAGIQIETEVTVGSLALNDSPVVAGAFIDATELASGALVFTPALNAYGIGYANFTFRVADNGSNSRGVGNLDPTPNRLTLDVMPVNDAPLLIVPNDQVTDEDTDLAISGFQVVDVDSTDLTVNLNVTNGILTLTPSATVTVMGGGTSTVTVSGTSLDLENTLNSLVYTPNPHYAGEDLLAVSVEDGDDGSDADSLTLTVNPVNDIPSAMNDTYAVVQDTTLVVNATLGVLANDTDIETSALTVSKVNGSPTDVGQEIRLDHGSLTLNSDGSFTYLPDPSFQGSDRFTYVANDGTADSEPASVTISVDPNDAGSVHVIPDDEYPGKTAVRIIGTSGDDTISVRPGSLPDTLKINLNGQIITIDAPTGRVLVFGRDGNDDLEIRGNIPLARVEGEGDNDTLTGGNLGDTLLGGPGDDMFRNQYARGRYDVYDGGEGLDTIVQTRDYHRFVTFSPDNHIEGLTIVNPNNGTRRVQGEGSGGKLLDFSGIIYVNDVPVAGGLGLDIRGTNDDDTITGTAGDDEISGRKGNDRISAGDGNDTVRGDAGMDSIVSGYGDDLLDGGPHVDETYGGPGNDVFIANLQDHVFDLIDGGSDLNTLRLNPQRNTSDPIVLAHFTPANQIQQLEGGSRILGTDTGNTLDFSAVTSWTTGNWVDGGKGDDTIRVPLALGGFQIDGGAGNDSLWGSAGNDTLRGDAGEDMIEAGHGDDLIDGGAGVDETYGGNGNDVFIANLQDHVFDLIDGGSDLNTLRLNPQRNTSDPIVLAHFTPANQIQQLEGGSRILGTDTGNTLDFSAVTSWTTGKWVDGGKGDDTIRVPLALGGFRIDGGAGNDSITGSHGNDRIDGGHGDDTIDAGVGNDELRGGTGTNSLTGGMGMDTFFFQDILEGQSDQQIKDFSAEDTLKFLWSGNPTLLFGDRSETGHFVFDRDTGKLYLPNGRTITLEGFFALTEDDIIWGTW